MNHDDEGSSRGSGTALKTQPKRQLGGPQSGFPPTFIIGQELAPYLIVGVDFGSTYCRVGAFANNEPLQVTQPSLDTRLLFGKDGEPLVGKIDDHVGVPIKLYLGQNILFRNGEASCLPTVAASQVFSIMKANVESVSQRLLAKAVITVPAGFNHLQRAAMVEAAEAAEIKVLGLINEPTAAALDTAFQTGLRMGKMLVLSAGASSCEVSAIDLQDGLLEVKATLCDRNLAGYRLTERIAEAVVEIISSENKQSSSLDSIELLKLSEKIKRKIGVEENLVFTEGVPEPVSLNSITERLKGYVDSVQSLIKKTLAAALIDPEQISAVVLHGGTARFQPLERMLRTVFPKARTLNADHVAASFGASIYAALQVRQAKDWVVWDVITNPVVFAQGPRIKSAIAANSPVPINGHAEFISNEESTVYATILQQRSDMGEELVETARLVVKNVAPGKQEGVTVDVGVACSADGLLTYTARHKHLDVPLLVEFLPMESTAPAVIEVPMIPTLSETPNKSISAPIDEKPIYTCGLAVRAISKNKFIVDNVEEDSPAAFAGVRVFDEIIQVIKFPNKYPNVVWFVSSSLASLASALEGDEGTRVALLLKRGEVEFCVSMEQTWPIGQWDEKVIGDQIVNAVLQKNTRRLISLFLELGTYECLHAAAPDYKNARSCFHRALDEAQQSLQPQDPLRIMALADLCWFEVNEAIRLLGDMESAASERCINAASQYCHLILQQTEIGEAPVPAACAKYLYELALTFIHAKELANFNSETERLIERAIEIGNQSKTPPELIDEYRVRLTTYRESSAR